MTVKTKTRKRVVRRRQKRHVPSNAQLNRKINALAKRSELKFFDHGISADSAGFLGARYLLNSMPISGDDSGRIGNEILMKSLTFRGFFQPQDTVDAAGVRIIVYIDRQPEGSIPGGSSLVGNDGSQSLLNNTAIDNGPLMTRNFNTHARYKVLYDKVLTFSMAAADAGINYTQRKFLHFKVPLNHKTRFKDSSGIDTSINTNGLILAFVGEEATAQIDYTFCCRLSYFDD